MKSKPLFILTKTNKTEIEGKVKENLKNVKHKILVLSGKGGVGKSTVCGQIAYALAAHFEAEDKQVDYFFKIYFLIKLLSQKVAFKKKIGVLDIDICGPSLPQVFGVQGEQIHQSGSGWSPIVILFLKLNFLLLFHIVSCSYSAVNQ